MQPASRQALTPPHVTSRPGLMAPSHAAVAAAGILAAIDVLGRPSVQRRRGLRWLTVEARARGQTLTPHGRRMGPRDQRSSSTALRSPRCSPPCGPATSCATASWTLSRARRTSADGRISALARSTPALLWPFWALRLAPSGSSARILSAALSVLVLLPGTKVEHRGSGGNAGERDDKADTQPHTPST